MSLGPPPHEERSGQSDAARERGSDGRARVFEAMRPRLFGIAYRMLRTRAEAEDVVQDAWLRFSGTDDVRSMEGFLVRTTTRLCLDREKSARARRERYVGPWLPEPIAGDEAADGEVERLESINFALLHVLGTLDALARAVFLLREVFDYGYDEIAGIVDRNADHCRQIAHRARTRVRGAGGSGSVDPEEHRRLLAAFLDAARRGQVAELEALLSDDAELIADGGGKVVSARNPVLGRRNVARFMAGIGGKAPQGITATVEVVNGLPTAIVRLDGDPIAVFALQIADGRIRRVFSVRNPDKLVGL